MIAICPLCGKEAKLTKDHIIPKWLYNRSDQWQFNKNEYKKNLGQKNIQMVCSPCNLKKGGRPDFTHPVARPLGELIIKFIQHQLKQKRH